MGIEENNDTSRKGISRDDLLIAALSLTGPERSVSSLSLREIARSASIAPNTFYRHFRDTNELSVTLIERAGFVLRDIIGEARHHAEKSSNIPRVSVEIFMQQLDAKDSWLPLLLREGSVGSSELKSAVEQQLQFFVDELHSDLVKLVNANGGRIIAPKIAATAITRLVFAMGTTAINSPQEERKALIDQTVLMVRMILNGAIIQRRA